MIKKSQKVSMPKALEKSRKDIDKHCLKFNKLLQSHLKKTKTQLRTLETKVKSALKKRDALLKKPKNKAAFRSAEKALNVLENEYQKNKKLLYQLEIESMKFNAKEKALHQVENDFKKQAKLLLAEKIKPSGGKAKKPIPHEKSLSPTVIILHDENGNQ